MASPRFVELFGAGHPTSGHLAVQDDVYRDRCTNPATIRGYLRGLDDLTLWSGGLRIPMPELREFDVAAFLRDQSSRGSSVPLRLYRTIVWLEMCFGGLAAAMVLNLMTRLQMVAEDLFVPCVCPP